MNQQQVPPPVPRAIPLSTPAGSSSTQNLNGYATGRNLVPHHHRQPPSIPRIRFRASEAVSSTPTRFRQPTGVWRPSDLQRQQQNKQPPLAIQPLGIDTSSSAGPESPNLSSEDANMSPASVHTGFTNGHAAAGGNMTGTGPTTNEDCGIREVWAHNLEEEFKTICQIIQTFPFVAMDTEFPGVVARPIGEFKSTADYQYQLLRCNVDLLKIIQLGLTFLDEKGDIPETGPSTWQFNFKFNLTEDMYAEDSVDLLQNSGIQFEKHEQEGIDPIYFAEYMLVSGLVLREPVKWLSFHSGYDFGYLLNLLTNQNLPKTEGEFFGLLKLYFPNVYDVKYLMKSCKNLKGGLQEVANELEVLRIGPQHQAGSDSLLTGQTFFKMKEMFFEDDIDDSKYCGHLYGLGTNFVVNKNNNSSSASLASQASSATTTTSSTVTTSSNEAMTTTTATSEADTESEASKTEAEDNGSDAVAKTEP